MIFIEGIHIEAFSPRLAFVNNTSICDEKVVDLANDLSKSMIDMLSHFHDSEEQKIVEKYIYKPSKEENICALFALYVAVLRVVF